MTPRAGAAIPTDGDYSAGSAVVRELQASFEAYRKEREENDRIKDEEMAAQRATLDEKRMEVVQLMSKLEQTGERYHEMRATIDGQIKEREQLMQRSHEHSATVRCCWRGPRDALWTSQLPILMSCAAMVGVVSLTVAPSARFSHGCSRHAIHVYFQRGVELHPRTPMHAFTI